MRAHRGLGDWVPFCQHGAWLDSGSRAPLRVSVHLSPRQLKDRALVAAVRDLGSECACDPRYLDLEVAASKTPVGPSHSSGT